MTSNVTIKASDVFAQINMPFSTPSIGRTGNNAVVDYVIDTFNSNTYADIDALVSNLALSSVSNGSFMCYTHQLEDFLKANLDDIEYVLDYYMDAMGEPVSFSSFSDMVAIAIDVVANELSHAVEAADLAIVVNHADDMDTDPEVIICDQYEADDKVSEIIQHRLDMEVQHSTETVTEEDLDEMEETLLQLVYTVV